MAGEGPGVHLNVALPPERLDYISVCTGGGGLDLGLELAMPNARAVCLVEREAFAVAHLVAAMQADLLAQSPVWSDVRTFPGRSFRGLVDGVIGGIPCQPHSLAGSKRGSHDERDLWSDARRIVVQSRPWFVLIENVSGMLSAGDDEIAGAERVWRDLRKLGYAVEIGLFTAAEVGATHERERIFILAMADASGGLISIEGRGPQGRNGAGPAGALVHVADPHIAQLRQEPSARQLAQLQPDDGNGRHIGLFPPGPSDLDGWRRVLQDSPRLEPAVRRMADGMAARLDLAGPHAARIERLRMLGNGVVPLQAAYAIRTLATRLAANGSAGAAFLVRMMELEAA